MSRKNGRPDPKFHKMIADVNAAFKVGTPEGIAFDARRKNYNLKCIKLLEALCTKYPGTRIAQIMSDLNFNEEPTVTYERLRKIDLNLAEEIEGRPWRTG